MCYIPARKRVIIPRFVPEGSAGTRVQMLQHIHRQANTEPFAGASARAAVQAPRPGWHRHDREGQGQEGDTGGHGAPYAASEPQLLKVGSI